jgi:hypothetical protein
MSLEQVKTQLRGEEDDFHNVYLQKYHRYQKKFKNIEQTGDLDKQEL